MDTVPKPTKITIRIEFADGSAVDVETVKPHDVSVDVVYPDPEYDFNYPNRMIAVQPAPTVTLRFTPDQKLGYTERHISRAEMEDNAPS